MTSLKLPANAGLMGLALVSGGFYTHFARAADLSPPLPPWAAVTCLLLGFVLLLICVLQFIYRFVQQIKSDRMENLKRQSTYNFQRQKQCIALEAKKLHIKALKSHLKSKTGSVKAVSNEDGVTMNLLLPQKQAKVKKSKTLVGTQGVMTPIS